MLNPAFVKYETPLSPCYLMHRSHHQQLVYRSIYTPFGRDGSHILPEGDSPALMAAALSPYLRKFLSNGNEIVTSLQ
jgi:hypothetical protein